MQKNKSQMMTFEANKLLALAEQQLEEQKSLMLKELADVQLDGFTEAKRNRVEQAIKAARLSMAAVNEHPLFKRAQQVRIAYELDDDLIHFLAHEAKLLAANKFPVLSSFMQGGIIVENKPTAIDPLAGKGKTKAKVRGL